MTAKREYLYGYHPVAESMRAGRRNIYRIFMRQPKPHGRLSEIVRMASGKGIPVSEAASGELKKIARSAGHQGVVAEVGPYPLVSFESLLGLPQESQRATVLLLLDSIEDTRNLGALVRTALCAGVQGVVLAKNRAAAPLPSVSKSSAGALEHSRVARVTNLVAAIEKMKANAFWIAGMDACAPQDLFHSRFDSRLGMVIGGEEKGMRPLVKKQCDYLVKIPMAGQVTSLNASVAGAVALYEVFRQMRIESNVSIRE